MIGYVANCNLIFLLPKLSVRKVINKSIYISMMDHQKSILKWISIYLILDLIFFSRIIEDARHSFKIRDHMK